LGRDLLTIYPKTFHCFQSSHKRRDEGRQLLEDKLNMLQDLGYLTETGLTEKGEFASTIFGYELMLAEMHSAGILGQLTESDLCVLLSGLIFEPRKNDFAKPLSSRHEELLKMANHHHRLIHKREEKHDVFPFTKRPHFFLAEPVERWVSGLSFDEVLKRTTEDEGSFVRHLRMIIQLLREIQHAPHSPAILQETAARARKLIDRDVVDAEKQLRV
jgi:ATP-dependent RNA helicase HelY